MTFFPNQNDPRNYGLYILPGVGGTYPDLAQRVASIVNNRIAGLSWVPHNFQEQYNFLAYDALQNNRGLVKPRPATLANGKPNPDAPDWLDTAEKRSVWDTIARTVDNAQVDYISELRVQGAAKLQELEDNANFWNGVAGGVQAAGEGIKSVGGGIGSAVSSIGEGVGSGLKTGLTIVVVVAAIAGVAYLYFTNAAFRRVVGGK